jgi:Transposase family tnp2
LDQQSNIVFVDENAPFRAFSESPDTSESEEDSDDEDTSESGQSEEDSDDEGISVSGEKDPDEGDASDDEDIPLAAANESDGIAMDADVTVGIGNTEGSHSHGALESNEFCHAKIKAMRDKLLDGYTMEVDPPFFPPTHHALTISEELTLQHFVAWSKSGGTVKAYTAHAAVLQKASGTTISSLYMARKLAAELTGLEPIKIDMCPSSCIAYVGEYRDCTTCPFIRKGKTPCGKARYKLSSGKKSKPCAQFALLSIVPIIKALFANAESAQLLRQRDTLLKEALHLVYTASQKMTFSDFGNGYIHCMHHETKGLFEDPRDIAFALSTDGAQLTMKKQSDTWIIVLILLNLPGSIRYKGSSTIIPMAIPGPNPPGDIESFLYTMFQHMAEASEGIWVWDAIESSYFVLRAHLCIVNGDMLGSAKCSGMAGHSAVFGDRFTMVQGARSKITRGAKAQYYPISAPDNEKKEYNPNRPIYDFNNLPMRTEAEYWSTIEKLCKISNNAAETSRIVRNTGVSRLPLCATSLAFSHPNFFPLDPFHLFYENCMAFIWDLWTGSQPSDTFFIPEEKRKTFGELIPQAMSTLPASFCGPVRDIFSKRHSQYKIYEWMALLHWYIIPIGIELGFNSIILQNFADFSEIITFAMTLKPRSKNELLDLHRLIVRFLCNYEKIYVGSNPENISRARLCIFQLVHIPQHILWNGNIRIGSQATVERSIGEMSRRIRSKKEVFANLTNQVYERELLKVLLLYYPTLDNSKTNLKSNLSERITMVKQMKILKKELDANKTLQDHIQAISQFVGYHIEPSQYRAQVARWGKVRLQDKLIHSRLSDDIRSANSANRYSRWFEV